MLINSRTKERGHLDRSPGPSCRPSGRPSGHQGIAGQAGQVGRDGVERSL